MAKEKLVAVAFGDDGFNGDSCFYPGEDAVPVSENASFDEIFAVWRAKQIKLGDWEECEDDNEKPIGFWVLTPKSLKIAKIAGSDDFSSDSACYAANRAVKRVCHHLAVRIVGDPSPLDGETETEDDDSDDED